LAILTSTIFRADLINLPYQSTAFFLLAVCRIRISHQISYIKPYHFCYSSFLKEQGVSLTYQEHAGGHEWDFWDWAMKQFLDWWISEDADQGVSSGNVKS